MKNLVIIRRDPRNFWHLDFYAGAARWSKAKVAAAENIDAFCTTRIGETLDYAKALAEKHWPGAVIRIEEEGKIT